MRSNHARGGSAVVDPSPLAGALLLALAGGAAPAPPRRGAAAGPRRAALRAGRGRDAPQRRPGDADAPGRAVAREAGPLLLAGRRLRSACSARRRPRPGCPRSAAAPAGRRHGALRRAPLRPRGRACTPASSSRTSLLVFAYGRAATMDMLLAASSRVAIGLLGAGRCSESPAASRSPWRGAALGLAALAKGPIGLLLPALVVAALRRCVTRDWRPSAPLLSPVGIVLFLLVAGPWYVLIYRAQGQAFLDVFLLNHNLQRFTSTIHNHPGPIYYYLPVLLVGSLPVVGPRAARLRRALARERPRPTSSCCSGSSCRSSSSRRPARSCPATSCPASRRWRC